MKSIVLPLVFTLALAGCSSLSKQECQQADWYLIGLEDGARGYDIQRIGQHREACAKVSVVPDLERYRAGLHEGHERYCTRDRGYTVGKSGQNNPHVCRGEAADTFNQAYGLGREHHRLQQAVSDLDRQLADHQEELAELAEDASYHEEQLLHYAQDAAERREHLQSIKAIEREIDTIHEAMTYLDRERTVALEDLHELSAEHRRLGFTP